MWISKEFEKQDFNNLLKLCYEYYGENDITNAKFINHEYFENFAGDAYIDLALDEHGKEIVGQYVAIPKQIRINETEKECILSLNTLTKKEYWGQGIFTGLAEKTYQRASENNKLFCYGAPNPNSHPGFLKKLGFHDLGNIPLWVKPLIPSALISQKTGKNWLGKMFKWSDFIFRPKFQKNPKYTIQKLDENNIELINTLWDKVKDQYPVCFVRNSKYIEWRYLNMPLRDYISYIVLEDNDICGFIVGRVMDVSGIRCGMIADFMFLKQHEEAGSYLLKYLINLFYEEKVSLIGSLMLSHTKESTVLKNAKFFICPTFLEPQPFPIIFRLFDENYVDKNTLDNFQNWFFTMGDYDVI